MLVHDDLGVRMKTYYEEIPKIKLMRRCPVVLRVDGKAFHSFTRGFEKPFDEILIHSMQQTMDYLCANIQGCVLGYQQSDEISLLLVDYRKLTSQAWFDYEVQKMCSITASMATMYFNQVFSDNVQNCMCSCTYDPRKGNYAETDKQSIFDRCADVYLPVTLGAMFDARCFNLPKEEVTNYFYWRQLDATRNSIQMVGQANFSHRELQGKSCNDIQDMLVTQRGINWNDYPTHQKRGSCCIKKEEHWVIDKEIPIFKGEGRKYIDDLIYIGEE